MRRSIRQAASSTPARSFSYHPPVTRYLRMDLNPIAVKAILQHQRDADAIASGENPNQINRLHAIPLTRGSLAAWESRQE